MLENIEINLALFLRMHCTTQREAARIKKKDQGNAIRALMVSIAASSNLIQALVGILCKKSVRRNN